MNRLVAWFASNPVAANLLMLFIVVTGLISVSQLRQEVFPNVAFEVISVSVVYPGAPPDEVEEAVCVRIEEAIHGVKGVDRTFSKAAEGWGGVWAQLALGADPRGVLDEIRTRVDALDTLPADAERPLVRELVDDSVLLALAVHGDAEEATLRSVADRVRDEISALAEVDRTELAGARPYELAIEVSESDLRRHGLTFDDVAAAVRTSSVDLAGGALKTSGGEILMRARGRAYRGGEFEDLVLLTRTDGTRLHLRDVATVVDGFAETDEKTRVDGRNAVIVRLMTSERENVLTISRAVRGYIERTRATLPEGVALDVWLDQSKMFESRRDLLLRNGAQGLCLILLVLAVFLPLRLAVWVSIGIPIAFFGALTVLPLQDVSINMMSLFAFIVALGLVVDDAIIIGENVARHQKRSGDLLGGAIAGVREVAVPVLIAVITTMFFLAPSLSLPTVIGKISRSLGVVVIACLLFSLVEALLILPAHLSYPVRHRTRGVFARIARLQQRVDVAVQAFIDERYRPWLARIVRWPSLTLAAGAVCLMLAISLLVGGWVRTAFLPNIEDDFVSARLVMPEGTPRQVVEAAAARLEAEALDLGEELAVEEGGPVHRHLVVAIGDPPDHHNDFQDDGDGPNVVNVTVRLVPGEERGITSLDIEERWRSRVGSIPAAVSLTFTGSDFDAGADVDVSLAGADRDTLRRAAEALEAQLAAMPGVREVAHGFQGGKQELRLHILPEAEAAGLTLAELARQLHQGFHGEEVQRVQRGRDDVAVVVRYPPEERRSRRDLENVRVRLPDGRELPFAAVARAEQSRGYAAIERRDRRSQVAVTADVDTSVASANEVLADIEANQLPVVLEAYPGVEYELFGVNREEKDLEEALQRTWLLALVASYALLAVPLRSYLQPLLILFAIPFGIVGGVVGHALLGLEFSSFSQIGFVALTGVVINDALVLIDRANRNRREGMSVFAAIEEAGATRFRAIVLTSLTTFFGLLPLLFERSAQAAWLKPMAVALGFGVIFATLITLVMLPAAYVALDEIARRVRGWRPPAASARGDTVPA